MSQITVVHVFIFCIHVCACVDLVCHNILPISGLVYCAKHFRIKRLSDSRKGHSLFPDRKGRYYTKILSQSYNKTQRWTCGGYGSIVHLPALSIIAVSSSLLMCLFRGRLKRGEGVRGFLPAILGSLRSFCVVICVHWAISLVSGWRGPCRYSRGSSSRASRKFQLAALSQRIKRRVRSVVNAEKNRTIQ